MEFLIFAFGIIVYIIIILNLVSKEDVNSMKVISDDEKEENVDKKVLQKEQGIPVENSDNFHTNHVQLRSLFLCNNVEEVKKLINLGADVNEIDEDGNTPLHLCNDIEIGKALIQAGANIYSKNKKGFTVKMMCKNKELYNYIVNVINIRNNAFQELEKISLEEELQITSEDIKNLINEARGHEKFDTLLFKIDSAKIAQKLIEAGIDVNKDYMPLHLYKSDEVVKALLEAGVNINGKDQNGNTSLHLCYNQNIAKMLIEAGANVNIKNDEGDTPLHLCENENVVKMLIEAGANVNIKNNEGNTPLFTWCIGHLSEFSILPNFNKEYFVNRDIAKMLIEAGTNLEEKNNNGMTLLDVCNDYYVLMFIYDRLDKVKLGFEKHFKVFKKIIEDAEEKDFAFFEKIVGKVEDDILIDVFFRCLINCKFNEYKKMEIILNNINNISKVDEQCRKQGILFEANNDFFWIKKLKDKGVKLDISNSDGENLLHKCTNYNVANLLINSGVNVNQKDKFGKSPLFYCKNKKIIELLINFGADVNLQDNNGMTVLHLCNSNDEMAEILLTNNANPNIKDIKGNTPLHYCKSRHVWNMLINAGAIENIKNEAGELPKCNEVNAGIGGWDGSDWYDDRDNWE